MVQVYLVGAGPGDPDLITLKALKCIQQADVILYDRLVNEQLLEHAKTGAELVFCGKHPKFHMLKQKTINYLLVKYAKQGKTVTRLKGGDPFVFGRGAEEAEALAKQGISFEVVPGITSGIAAPAYAGIPVTHRDISSSFAVIAGHRCKGKHEEIDWNNLSKSVDTLAIYMGVSNLPYICDQLLQHEKMPDTPVAVIQQGTTEKQKVVTGTLSNIIDEVERVPIRNPAMIIIGEVVHFRERIRSFSLMHQNDNELEAAEA
ncbi:uroporphyrin-III C-methyltransferase [Thalassobacillus devorans]|uniref:uroporphyrinogen-III C-methyltransferase n=1 Tax=Thalassobacillus devorans TaxID=279813 RepID=A0ABQ1NRL1_9BACI|nr:uroporphyrinogen-III C-methyltransferase [Thalassobacillus devorans]NIK28831.1 uroporphyrin-III C-methyltransferase [Thalassobacillus devorans]GGC83214.1 uroporphyrin-III C-methyltransferase [Thalassobacillus devorans]